MALIQPNDLPTSQLLHTSSTPSPPTTPATALLPDARTASSKLPPNNSSNINIDDSDDDNEGWDDLDLRPLEQIFNRSPLSLSDSSSASDPGDYFQIPVGRHAPSQKHRLPDTPTSEHPPRVRQLQQDKELPPIVAHRPCISSPRPLLAKPEPSPVATTFSPTPVTPTPPSRHRSRPASSSLSPSSATAAAEAPPTSSSSSPPPQDSLEALPQSTRGRLDQVPPALTPASAPPPSLRRQNSFKLPAYTGTITRIYAQLDRKEVVNDWADDLQLPSDGLHFSQVRAALAARSSNAQLNDDEEALALMDEAIGLSRHANGASTCAAISSVRHTSKNHTTQAAANTSDTSPALLLALSSSLSSHPASSTRPSLHPSSSSPLSSSPLRPRPQLTSLALAKTDHHAVPSTPKSPTSLLAHHALSSPPASPASATISTSPALTTTAIHANATLVRVVASDAAQALKKTVSAPAIETIETLDDDFDLPEDLDPMELVLKWRRGLEPNAPLVAADGAPLLNATRWRSTSDSEVEEIDFGTPLDTGSLASSASLSRDATATTTISVGVTTASFVGDEENFIEGIEFPDSFEGFRLVTGPTAAVEKQQQLQPVPSLREIKKKKSDEEFWDGIELDEDGDAPLPLHRRNKYVVVRDGPASIMKRRLSRVCREEVPLKDFVAAPSKIPRLTRPPGSSYGDYSRPASPAPTLSRSHSTHLDLPLVVQDSSTRSSLPRPAATTRGSIRSKTVDLLHPRGSLALSMSDSTIITSSVQSTPLASRASTPTLARLPFQLQEHGAVDDNDEEEEQHARARANRAIILSHRQDKRLPRPPPLQHTGRRALEGLRSLARKLEPKIARRREMPLFEGNSSNSNYHNKAALPPLPTMPSSSSSIGLAASKHLMMDMKQQQQARPSFSRSSSFTDWETELDLDDLPANGSNNNHHRTINGRNLLDISNNTNDGHLSCVSTMSEAKSVASSTTIGMLFPKRVFLRRRSKYGTFGDGSELDRFDILPTYDREESRDPRRNSDPQPPPVPASSPANNIQSSAERVTAWLRKPTSMSNLRPTSASTPSSKPELGRMPKSKSIRRSLFDIFGQSVEPITKEPKKKKTKPGKGPTLIRNLSQPTKPKDVAGMVYNPEHKMWDGNNDILDEFESITGNDNNEPFTFPAPPPVPSQLHLAPQFQQRPPLSSSPSIWSASTVARPALISHMGSHYGGGGGGVSGGAVTGAGGQRQQMSGKMVFDPVSMSWRINPAYLALRRTKRRLKTSHDDDVSDLDDAWGDEPNVFAGLSDDSDKSDDDDIDGDDDHDDDGDERHDSKITAAASAGTVEDAAEGAGPMDELDDNNVFGEVDNHDEKQQHEQHPQPQQLLLHLKPALKESGSSNGRKSRFGSIRLQIPPSITGEDLSKIDNDDATVDPLAMWSEEQPPSEPSSAVLPNGFGGGSIRGFPQLRTVHSKSSRKSLRACLAAANGSLGNGPSPFASGGYSSRDEFEVGLEFDITDKFLEECMAAEAQHRRDAGRFFALPCSPPVQQHQHQKPLSPITPAATVTATITKPLRRASASSERSSTQGQTANNKKSTLPRKIKQATLRGLFGTDGGDKSIKTKSTVEVSLQQQAPEEQQQPEKQATKKKSLMSLRARIKSGNKSAGATLALDASAAAATAVSTKPPLHRRLPLPEAFRKHKPSAAMAAPAPAAIASIDNMGQTVDTSQYPKGQRQQPLEPPQTDSYHSQDDYGADGLVPTIGKATKRTITFSRRGKSKAQTLSHAAATSIRQQLPEQEEQQTSTQQQRRRASLGGGKALLALFTNSMSTSANTTAAGSVSSDANGNHRCHPPTHVCKKATAFDDPTFPQRLSYAATLALVRRGHGPYSGINKAMTPTEAEAAALDALRDPTPSPSIQDTSSSTSTSASTGSSSLAVVDLKQLMSTTNGTGVDVSGCTCIGSSSGVGDDRCHGVVDDPYASDGDDDDEAYESDQMERGYRVQSTTRGRPPPHRLVDILHEFERATVAREHQQQKKMMKQEQQQQQLQKQQALVVAAKQLR